MQFFGHAPLTLLDLPGKVATTYFTGGCNLRCPFCHNAGLVLAPGQNQPVSEQEVLAYLAKRKGVLDGVCFTGGEPLMHKDLPDFLKKLRPLGLTVKLDTNGCYPDALAQVLAQGLVDYVAMDIKNAPEAYGETVGIPDFDPAPVMQSLALLRQYAVAYELRTTVIRPLHNKERLVALAKWIAPAEHYYLQQFVDSGNLLCGEALSAYAPQELEDLLKAVQEILPTAALRGV